MNKFKEYKPKGHPNHLMTEEQLEEDFRQFKAQVFGGGIGKHLRVRKPPVIGTPEERLMPDGIPKYIRCFDAGKWAEPRGLERWIITFLHKNRHKLPDGKVIKSGSDNDHYVSLWVSTSGLEFSEVKTIKRPFGTTASHIGKTVKFKDLPEPVRERVVKRYRELWRLEDGDNKK